MRGWKFLRSMRMHVYEMCMDGRVYRYVLQRDPHQVRQAGHAGNSGRVVLLRLRGSER